MDDKGSYVSCMCAHTITKKAHANGRKDEIYSNEETCDLSADKAIGTAHRSRDI